MDFDNTDQVRELAALPPEKPKPASKWNGWSAPLRGITAGVSESGAMAADTVKGAAQTEAAYAPYSAGGMFSLRSDKEKREAELLRAKIATEGIDTTSGVGTALREVSRHYRPDPATAGLAEKLAFDLPRFAVKAVGYTVSAGPVPGAVMLGVDEGMQTSDDLKQQGVDKNTRMKVGAVAGVVSTASVMLPVAAPGSIPKTVGLWAAGGPGSFMAQQAATREILKDANYEDLAKQYDPLDLTGVLVASAVPAGFAAYAVAGARRTKAGAPAPVVAPEVQPTAKPESTPLTQEQADAVMTHNLTLAQDVRDATPPAEAVRQMTQLPERQTVNNAITQEMAARIEKDFKGAADEYAKIKSTDNGRILNTDDARELSPAYRADRTKSADVHEPASAFVKRLYAEKLAQPTPAGRDPLVLFTAGGTGAGKSSGLELMQKTSQRAEIIYDTNMNSLDSSVTKIDQALSAGRDVEIIYTFRDPVEALTVGALPRAERMGRTVPLREHARTHMGSAQTMRELQAKYADDPRVQIRVVDNSLGKNNAKISQLDKLPAQDYSGIEDKLYAALNQEYSAGRITETVYRGTAGNDSRAAVGLDRSRNSGQPEQNGYGQGTRAQDQLSAAVPKAGDMPAEPGASSSSPPPQKSPLIRSVLSRADEVERTNPDMVVGQDSDGQPITVKQEMERLRRESIEGTDTELGTQDAPLLQIAADCALSTGTM